MESQQKTEEFICKFCQRQFRRHKTLTAHVCEKKRRHQMRTDPAVMLGLQAYLKFYNTMMASSKARTYDDFADSSYYRAFVKFGNYLRSINAISPQRYIEWIIKRNIKLDHWCHDVHYETFLQEHLRREAVQDAMARTVECAEGWAKDNNSQFNQIFLYGNPNKIVFWITQGRISPWTLYNCASGVEFVEKLNAEQMSIVYKWIDPQFWSQRFRDYPSDQRWCQQILNSAGF
jgi:hypothetical protein